MQTNQAPLIDTRPKLREQFEWDPWVHEVNDFDGLMNALVAHMRPSMPATNFEFAEVRIHPYDRMSHVTRAINKAMPPSCYGVTRIMLGHDAGDPFIRVLRLKLAVTPKLA